MKVRCVSAPAAVGGASAQKSDWVAVGDVYDVISLLTKPGGSVKLHILIADEQFAWFDARNFQIVDNSIPANWAIDILGDGFLELSPASWQETGFWESYYDDVAEAVACVRRELGLILDSRSR